MRPPAMHHALTVIGSSMTSTLHSHFAVSGLSITACATSRLVIRSTRPTMAGSVTSLPAVPSSFICARYASFEAAIALSSETNDSWRRPVGLTAHALSSPATSNTADSLASMAPLALSEPVACHPHAASLCHVRSNGDIGLRAHHAAQQPHASAREPQRVRHEERQRERAKQRRHQHDARDVVGVALVVRREQIAEHG